MVTEHLFLLEMNDCLHAYLQCNSSFILPFLLSSIQDVREHAWKIWNEWYKENSSFTLAPTQEVLTELIRSGYIEACLRLAWRMVTQRPPLRLEYNSSIFDHHIHKKANGDTSQEEITCYLWPCLFDGGAKLICPGLVLCKM